MSWPCGLGEGEEIPVITLVALLIGCIDSPIELELRRFSNGKFDIKTQLRFISQYMDGKLAVSGTHGMVVFGVPTREDNRRWDLSFTVSMAASVDIATVRVSVVKPFTDIT